MWALVPTMYTTLPAPAVPSKANTRSSQRRRGCDGGIRGTVGCEIDGAAVTVGVGAGLGDGRGVGLGSGVSVGAAVRSTLGRDPPDVEVEVVDVSVAPGCADLEALVVVAEHGARTISGGRAALDLRR